MTSRHEESPERPPLCELRSLGAAEHRKSEAGDTIPPDGYTRCPNDAVGKYRIAPDAGGEAVVWLCDDHETAYADRIVATVEHV